LALRHVGLKIGLVKAYTYDIMSRGKETGHSNNKPKGISMKTPALATEENLSPYTDIQTFMRLSGKHRSHVGMGTLSQKNGDTKIHFDRRVEMESRSKADGQSENSLEVVPVSESHVADFTERFRSVVVVKATDKELVLRSKEARIWIYLPSSLHYKIIEGILSRCKTT
jgi:hypothetical protein